MLYFLTTSAIEDLPCLDFVLLVARSNLRSGIHPAINGKIRPGNVRGLRTGDERHCGGDLVNTPIAVERRSGLLWHRPIAACRIQIRVDRTRLDVVDRDAPAPDLSGQC